MENVSINVGMIEKFLFFTFHLKVLSAGLYLYSTLYLHFLFENQFYYLFCQMEQKILHDIFDRNAAIATYRLFVRVPIRAQTQYVRKPVISKVLQFGE